MIDPIRDRARGTADMAYDKILSPITINKLGIKNRVVRTAHGTNLGGGNLSDDLISYHEARARWCWPIDARSLRRSLFRPDDAECLG